MFKVSELGYMGLGVVVEFGFLKFRFFCWFCFFVFNSVFFVILVVGGGEGWRRVYER